MNAPLIIHETEYTSQLYRELEYQQAVTAVMLATTRPAGRTPRGPMFTANEIREMDVAMSMGLSAAGFAARLVAADKKAGVQ